MSRNGPDSTLDGAGLEALSGVGGADDSFTEIMTECQTYRDRGCSRSLQREKPFLCKDPETLDAYTSRALQSFGRSGHEPPELQNRSLQRNGPI